MRFSSPFYMGSREQLWWSIWGTGIHILPRLRHDQSLHNAPQLKRLFVRMSALEGRNYSDHFLPSIQTPYNRYNGGKGQQHGRFRALRSL